MKYLKNSARENNKNEKEIKAEKKERVMFHVKHHFSIFLICAMINKKKKESYVSDKEMKKKHSSFKLKIPG